jgi:PKD repeat protein
MHITSFLGRQSVRVALISVLGAAFAACGVDKQTAPDLAGPSEFAQAITLSATPDHLLQDGASKTVISALVRDESGRPISGLGIRWNVVSSDGTTFAQTADQSGVTGSDGHVSTSLTAPPAPVSVPAIPVVLTVTATPIEKDFSQTTPRSVEVVLVPPTGTLPTNNPPVADFTFTPAAANVGQSIRFDASLTTDEGQPCGSRCHYMWDFGDSNPAPGDSNTSTGIDDNHAFQLPGTYTVTLTVTDARGGVGSKQKSVTVNGPTPPVAQFTVTPSSPSAGALVTFNAGGSSVGTGATITQYTWDFGDGSPIDQRATPSVTHTYAAAGTYVATLTVTDSLGRKATMTATITVQ